MTERTREDWGRAAVALPGWRWLPGMVDIIQRQSILSVSSTGAVMAVFPPRPKDRRAVGRAPDPDDPATAGCLLALLEPAGPCPWRRPGGLWVVTMGQPMHMATMFPTTLGRACIAAAIALGRWPGGAK